jgi:hypothetical protein
VTSFPERSLQVLHFNEPLLEFNFRQTTPHPKDGLFLYGPYERSKKTKEVRVGVIGTISGIKYFRAWAARLKKGIPVPPPGKTAPVPYFAQYGIRFIYHLLDQDRLPRCPCCHPGLLSALGQISRIHYLVIENSPVLGMTSLSRYRRPIGIFVAGRQTALGCRINARHFMPTAVEAALSSSFANRAPGGLPAASRRNT